MKREITEEARQKMAEAVAQKSAIRQRRLVVGAWSIYRIDPMNVVLQKGEDGDHCYYPDVPSALKSLLRKLTDPTAKQTLADHVRVIEKAERSIMEAIAAAGGLGSLFGAGELA